MSTNTSATGGYLSVTSLSPEGNDLEDIFHDFFVNATGLSNTLVRPFPVMNPPSAPLDSTDWLSFTINNQKRDYTGNDVLSQDGFTTTTNYRNEEFSILINLYGNNCNTLYSKLTSFIQVEQNRVVLNSYDIGYVDESPLRQTYTEVNNQLLVRLIYTLNFRRTVKTVTNVNSLLTFNQNIITN